MRKAKEKDSKDRVTFVESLGTAQPIAGRAKAKEAKEEHI